jgi:hypothetical protein
MTLTTMVALLAMLCIRRLRLAAAEQHVDRAGTLLLAHEPDLELKCKRRTSHRLKFHLMS